MSSSSRPDFTIYHPIAPCAANSADAAESFQASERDILFLAMKYASGTTKTRPVKRPRNRWLHSQKKMRLKSSIVIEWFNLVGQ